MHFLPPFTNTTPSSFFSGSFHPYSTSSLLSPRKCFCTTFLLFNCFLPVADPAWQNLPPSFSPPNGFGFSSLFPQSLSVSSFICTLGSLSQNICLTHSFFVVFLLSCPSSFPGCDDFCFFFFSKGPSPLPQVHSTALPGSPHSTFYLPLLAPLDQSSQPGSPLFFFFSVHVLVFPNCKWIFVCLYLDPAFSPTSS